MHDDEGHVSSISFLMLIWSMYFSYSFTTYAPV